MIRVLSRNARFRKKIRGKWKYPLLPKVLGLFWPYDSKLRFVLYAYMSSFVALAATIYRQSIGRFEMSLYAML